MTIGGSIRLALGAAALAGTAATAKQFTLLIYEAPQQVALRTAAGPEGSEYWSAFAAIGGDLATSGVLRGGAALEPGAAAVIGKLPAAAGPTGYFIIDVPDLPAARGWVAKIPAATTGRVDVREHAAAKTGM